MTRVKLFPVLALVSFSLLVNLASAGNVTIDEVYVGKKKADDTYYIDDEMVTYVTLTNDGDSDEKVTVVINAQIGLSNYYLTKGDCYVKADSEGHMFGLIWKVTKIAGKSEYVGTAWATILGTSEQMWDSYDFYVEGKRKGGGTVLLVNKFELLAPYIGLTSIIIVVALATIALVKRRKHNNSKIF